MGEAELLIYNALVDGRVVDGTRFRLSNRYWVIDAKPHVMGRLRMLFKSAQGLYIQGTFTHKPIAVPKTSDVAKDIEWFCSRYPLEYEDGAGAEVARLVNKYDDAINAASAGDGNTAFDLSESSWLLARPPYPEQASFYNLCRKVRRMLLADEIGEGKTVSAFTLLCEPDGRPALIVVPTHLCTQWQKRLREFLPLASSHVIKGTKNYVLPKVDVLITAYTRLDAWQDVLVPMAFSTVVFDEVQDLRHTGTKKRGAARALSERAEYCVGLSATPIYNFGVEVWSVLDVINPDCLGPGGSFVQEWCSGDVRVKDPMALHSYLQSRGLMLRRAARRSSSTVRDIVTLDGDLDALNKMEDVLRSLAMSVLSGKVGESGEAAREMDWKLRQATGLAKAKPVAQFVKMLCESGEKVVLAGWHRAVYDVWLKELSHFHPVLYTGTESPVQKEKSIAQFVYGQSQVFVLSLRSGSGLDALQLASSTVVFGELDWSPHVMNQLIGRLDRKGQKKEHVNAYFLVVEDGSDPFILDLVADKVMQHEGVIEGKEGAVEVIADVHASDRLRDLATSYLASIGASSPIVGPSVGLHWEVESALRRLRLTFSSEAEMQQAVWSALPPLVDAKCEKEKRLGKRSRLDFVFYRKGEVVAVECKIDQTGRTAVYSQIRRYIDECGVTGVVLFAPWSGVRPFVINDVPVTIVDWARLKL